MSESTTDRAMMQAATYRRYGGPEVVTVASIPRPDPQGNQVLIRVVAAALNPYDWHFMRGKPYLVRFMAGLRAPKRTTLGADVAGVVEAVGDDVTRFAPGDEVFGEIGLGAFGEFAVAREAAVVAKPEGVPMRDAAAVAMAGITALQGLRDSGELRAGQHVLVNGASGGVGTCAVQIAKALGAEVTGVCGPSNGEMVRSIGADHVLDYTQVDVTETDNSFDLILDTVSTHSLRAYRRIMEPQAHYVSLGSISMGDWIGPLTELAKTAIANRRWSQSFSTMLARVVTDDLEYLAGLMAEGSLRPVVDRTYPLAHVAEAIRYVEGGHAAGKVTLEI